MLGINIKVDQKSIDKAKKTLDKPSKNNSAVTTGASAGADESQGGEEKALKKLDEGVTKNFSALIKGLGTIAGIATAAIAFLKPIAQVLGVIGAILSIGLKPLLPLLRIFLLVAVWVFKKLADFLKGGVEWVWENLLSPIWEGIKEEWEKIKPVFQALWEGIVWVWENLLKPVFLILWEGIKWIWNNLLKPVFLILWEGIKFVWDLLKGAFSLWWKGVKLYWSLLKSAFQALWSGIKWVWNNLLKPVWNWVSEKFKSIWNDIILPVWEFIKDKFNDIKKFLGKIAGKIKEVFNKIKDAISKIPFVGGSSGGKEVSGNDMLITKKGDMVHFNPNDNIMAFQDKPMSSGTTINIRVDGFVGDEDLLAEKIEKAISSRNRGGLSQF